MKQTIVRILLALASGLFVWAGWLQVNDADPALWGAIYGGAAVMCGVAAAGVRVPIALAGSALAAVALGVGYLAWQIFVLGEVRPMYAESASGDPDLLATEEGREMLGLVIVAAGLGLVVRESRASDEE